MGRLNTVDSVWRKVGRCGPTECWPWLGYVTTGKRSLGYGRIDIGKVEGVYAHRAAFVSANPEAGVSLKCDDGLFVLHSCDNPRCCNPKHLRIGTHDDNMRDKTERGRNNRFKSTESPNAKLSSDDVIDIRIMKKMGATKRGLSLLYDVSTSTISHCVYGRSYQDVT